MNAVQDAEIVKSVNDEARRLALIARANAESVSHEAAKKLHNLADLLELELIELAA